MKLCINCKWVRYSYTKQELCGRPQKLSPVNGQAVVCCFSERSNYSSCGAEGNYWEEKPATAKPKSWWRRLWD